MPKRAVFERSRQELSLDVSVGVHILLVVEQSGLESQSRRYAKSPIFTCIQDWPSHKKPEIRLSLTFLFLCERETTFSYFSHLLIFDPRKSLLHRFVLSLGHSIF